MELVGAFVFPHGSITLDPNIRDFSDVPANLPTSKEECIKLHDGMKQAAEDLIATKPDVIFMSTPHGLTLQKHYLFVGNNLARGSAKSISSTGGVDWANYTAEIRINSQLTGRLVKHLNDKGNPVEILRLGGLSDPVNLRWGEVVPWWFINEAAKKAGIQSPPAILFGHARIWEDKALLKLGADSSKFLRSDKLIGKRVAIVISSDLSHYHSADPTSPYHYNENATVFDQIIQDWAKIDYTDSKESLEEMDEYLLKKGGDLSNSIGSCGYTGLVFLHGFMKEYLHSKEYSNNIFKAYVYYYSAPTYFGMLASSWIH